MQYELDLLKGTMGGWRPGAGRKRDPEKRDLDHVARDVHRGRVPLHVTLRCAAGVPRLRCGGLSAAIRGAMARVKGRCDGFRVIHVSVQKDHLHFVIEAKDSRARALGMAGLEIAIARAINKACGRRGKVFAYRYHAVPLTTPMQVRNVLSYVLGNWRHHREDEGSLAARCAVFDPYASAPAFDGWTRPFDGSWHFDFPVDPATLWLLAVGWRKHGPIDPLETPGADSGNNRRPRRR